MTAMLVILLLAALALLLIWTAGERRMGHDLSAILARTPSTSELAEPLPGAWCRVCLGARGGGPNGVSRAAGGA
jgi:hypothetical protein